MKKCDLCNGVMDDPTSDYKHAHKGCWDDYQQALADDFMLDEMNRNEEF
jgi:hypothetical protein